ncbi:MAG: DEAD/DEAH box helicase [Firmicutes bacterium]|jgi:superfamily II DNA or RNA helicase|nr:DEAD/DEAH box helicase [Bacillota bacterium]
MSRVIKLRPWQKEALSLYEKKDAADFFLVATPGAGKTTFALLAARSQIITHNLALIVVVPTAHLKSQWAQAAAFLGLQVDTNWTPGRAVISDFHGVVTTYQQVLSNPNGFMRLGRHAFVIIDEIHHAGDDKSWGTALMTAFSQSPKRLLLSGTPFRSDYAAIPFVDYQDDLAVADFEYGYSDALNEGHVVRPIYFPRVGGEMEWSANDGSLYMATFDDALVGNLANQRLRTALSPEGDWLREVMQQSNAKLQQIRKHHRDAGGLVIASDQEHARKIKTLIHRELGLSAALAVSDDNDASVVIERYTNSDQHWLVAVKMVSEGVDIPRLRVGVYATTTATELFFRQAAGRLVRFVSGLGNQPAYLYIPDDPRLRHFAQNIAQARYHSIKRNQAPDQEEDFQLFSENSEQRVMETEDFQQLSLFSPIRSVASEDIATDVFFEGSKEADSDDPSLLIELVDLPREGDQISHILGAGEGKVHLAARELNNLRKQNAALVKRLVDKTGLSYAKVNAELNMKAGLTSVAAAGIKQLQQRIKEAERWLQHV